MKVIYNEDKSCFEITIQTKTKPDQLTIDKIKKIINEPIEINGYDHRGNIILLKVNDIIFFQTSDLLVYAHTLDRSYIINQKLYQLEEKLSTNFIRVSKASIVNVDYISSIEKSLYSSRKIIFYNTDKIIYVSRHYNKALLLKLKENKI